MWWNIKEKAINICTTIGIPVAQCPTKWFPSTNSYEARIEYDLRSKDEYYTSLTSSKYVFSTRMAYDFYLC